MIKRILLDAGLLLIGAVLFVVAIIINFSAVIGMGFLIYAAFSYTYGDFPTVIFPTITGILFILAYFLFANR